MEKVNTKEFEESYKKSIEEMLCLNKTIADLNNKIENLKDLHFELDNEIPKLKNQLDILNLNFKENENILTNIQNDEEIDLNSIFFDNFRIFNSSNKIITKNFIFNYNQDTHEVEVKHRKKDEILNLSQNEIRILLFSEI